MQIETPAFQQMLETERIEVKIGILGNKSDQESHFRRHHFAEKLV